MFDSSGLFYRCFFGKSCSLRCGGRVEVTGGVRRVFFWVDDIIVITVIFFGFIRSFVWSFGRVGSCEFVV